VLLNRFEDPNVVGGDYYSGYQPSEASALDNMDYQWNSVYGEERFTRQSSRGVPRRDDRDCFSLHRLSA
jgi:hypothetical protein